MLLQELTEELLHFCTGDGIGAPLSRTTPVAEPAEQQPAICQLLPVLEAPTVVDRPPEAQPGDRSRCQHLQPQRSDVISQFRQQLRQSRVTRHNDSAGADAACGSSDLAGG